MFAVKGWAVSAEGLKAETSRPTDKAKSGVAASQATDKPKKRKRHGGESTDVTPANVADLWDSVIAGKRISDDGIGNGDEARSAKRQQKRTGQPSPELRRPGMDVNPSSGRYGVDGKFEKKEKKKDKKGDVGLDSLPPPRDEKSPVAARVEDRNRTKPKKLGRKEREKLKKQAEKPKIESTPGTPNREGRSLSTQAQPEQAPPLNPTHSVDVEASAEAPLPPATKLTASQALMRQKLISAHFRFLNEMLYTRPSGEALELFREQPDMFADYHEGFRRQVQAWPENPVDGYVRDILARAAITSSSSSAGPPLPRSHGICTITDLGCGDARLAATLQPSKKKLRLEIQSYDLRSPNPLVTEADIANLPLNDGSVDLAIFCLALMGTNWLSFVEEAYRVLRWKGELWVAEVQSRFGYVRGRHAPVGHSVGSRKKNDKHAKAKNREAEEAVQHEALAVEVDGADDRRTETDVTAFVEALRRRGFILHGENAVELGNKMFVKMRFAKAATPTKGKGARERDVKGPAQFGRKKFVETEPKEEVNESTILKPCLYKTR